MLSGYLDEQIGEISFSERPHGDGDQITLIQLAG